MNTQFKTIDEYINSFPDDIQLILETMRQTIRKAAPESIEVISYRMPDYKLNGSLVWFAAFKNHIGFYPTSSGVEAFKIELSSYKTSKGAIQFPLDKPIPYDLVEKNCIISSKGEFSKKENIKQFILGVYNA